MPLHEIDIPDQRGEVMELPDLRERWLDNVKEKLRLGNVNKPEVGPDDFSSKLNKLVVERYLSKMLSCFPCG